MKEMQENKEELLKWMESNKLDFQLEELENNIICIIDNKKYLLLQEKNEVLFDADFHLILSEEEISIIDKYNIDFYLFNFGNNYFYTKKGSEETPELNVFKYVGNSKKRITDIDFIPLGVHSGYELLNGNRNYKDWLKKAKFLGYSTLGICERNTLAGAMEFQSLCKKENIKPIFGEEVVIYNGDSNYCAKLYVINEIGWRNILLINAQINVFNVDRRSIDESKLIELSEGLIFVFNSDVKLTRELVKLYSNTKFIKIYYQIDSVEWSNEEKDKTYLENLKYYLENYIDKIEPILINDSYYLDEEDNGIKKFLNKLGNLSHQSLSKNQYFKDLDDNFDCFDSLFNPSDERFSLLFEKGVENTVVVNNLCDFIIPTGKLYLPKYIMNENEKLQFNNNEDLFWNLIEKGIEKKLTGKVHDIDIYIERIEKEYNVIKKGGIVDYFLILWDIIEWCKTQNILTGFGRGSAAGSLISYLLDITRLDPIQYNLLFERFLNEGRIGKSLPDIDVDFQADRKEEVKGYIRSKYGEDYFCAIGTYQTFQLKVAIADLSREYNISVQDKNYLTKILDDKIDGNYNKADFLSLFHNGIKLKPIKDFIQSNIELVNKIPLLLQQQRSASTHACATVIVPKDKTIYEWIPLRKEGQELVSEWEGKYIEEIGLLKEDVLGISQLDKFSFILNLIKKNTGEDIDIYSLPVDDKKVYEYFKNGWNEDLFHFGSRGLTNYCIQLQPDNIEDIIAVIALYRPGTMYLGSHVDYIHLKNGTQTEEYDFGCEEITKNTKGLIIYQEQVMQICQHLGGFTLVDADGIRKAMGKKSVSLIESYKAQFIKYSTENMNCPLEEAEKIWHKMELFAEYCFNRSHAACYALTGYVCQWLKVHYPIQYWTAALEFAKDDKIGDFLYEISVNDDYISIKPPEINKSHLKFYTDFEKGIIYWTLGKISQVGEVTTKAILDEREVNGEFFSFEEFISRVDKSKVNKRTVENLIYAGCFDEIENIKTLEQRKTLLVKYKELMNASKKKKKEDVIIEYSDEKYWWALKQYEVSKFAYFDWKVIISNSNLKNSLPLYKDINTVNFEILKNKRILICGIVVEIIVRNGKKGEYAMLNISSNNKKVNIICWTEKWMENRSKLLDSKGKILLLTGSVKFYADNQSNGVQFDDSSEFEILS